jgi:hypothetical protein
MKRRDFLFSIASAIPAAAILPSAAQASTSPRATRIGLLLPKNADLERQFTTGWRVANGLIPTVSARVGTHSEALKEVKSWLEDDRVDMIVSAFSAHGAEVRALLEGRGVPMLVADFGANWARSGSALVVRQGLRMAEGAFALGQRTARTGTRTAAIVTSGFDAGFDHVRAFRLGFEGQGGRILDTLLLDSSAVTWDAGRLHELRADAVFVAASDAESLSKLRLPLGTRLFASGLAPWLLKSMNLETALAADGSQHPVFTLGLEAAHTVARANTLMGNGLHSLPALLQARLSQPLRHLELRTGRVVAHSDLEDAPHFDTGAQMMAASRTGGYSNAYPVL